MRSSYTCVPATNPRLFMIVLLALQNKNKINKWKRSKLSLTREWENGKVMNEWTIALPINKDESRRHTVEWEKQISEDDKVNDSIFITTSNNMYYEENTR